jgi:hypothetical protein
LIAAYIGRHLRDRAAKRRKRAVERFGGQRRHRRLRDDPPLLIVGVGGDAQDDLGIIGLPGPLQILDDLRRRAEADR